MRKSVVLTLAVLMALVVTTAMAQDPEMCGTSETVTLFAGQDIPVGLVHIWNTPTDVKVMFSVDEPWLLTETHVVVAENSWPPEVKTKKKGNPRPGRFPSKVELTVPSGDPITNVIPLKGSWNPGDTLMVAAHCKVVVMVDLEIIMEESAWAGEEVGQIPFGGRNWATYVEFDVRVCPE